MNLREAMLDAAEKIESDEMPASESSRYIKQVIREAEDDTAMPDYENEPF